MADAVFAANIGQKVPSGYCKEESMLSRFEQRDDELSTGCKRSTMAELGQWTIQADKVLVF